MFDQGATELSHETLLFTELDEKHFDVSALRTWARARDLAVDLLSFQRAPIEKREEATIALHHRIMCEQEMEGRLVKGRGVWYHG